MKRISFVLLLVFSPILCLYAQNGEITGRIRDLITENSIDSKVPKPGRYILRCMAVGYKTMYFPIHVKYTSAKTKYDVGDFYLQESFVQLGEAVVKGTKIRMFYKGDTLVYNASAFHLPDGSMLNDLVAQLPGAEIRDGNIYVNGRLVENLLLGGKDFFNGNPRAALASLPAYVAKNVKEQYDGELDGRRAICDGCTFETEVYRHLYRSIGGRIRNKRSLSGRI